MRDADREDWTPQAGLADLPAAERAALAALGIRTVARGQTLFHPGEPAQGFVVVLSGRVEVYLTGPTGREIMLYAVEPGQSCVQSTLGLLGGEDYAGEAVTATDSRLVLIPRGHFLRLMDDCPPFRSFVFRTFARRMQDMTQLLERVAFQRVEHRLAAALLALAEGDEVQATQADLAARIGSAREVVSRRLDALARAGLVSTDRGLVRLLDRDGLERLAGIDG